MKKRGRSQSRNDVFLRGGNWNETTNAGAFTLNLNNNTGNQNNNIGFRCASDPVAISSSFSSSSGRAAAGGNVVSVGSLAPAKVFQNLNVGDTASYDLSVYGPLPL